MLPRLGLHCFHLSSAFALVPPNLSLNPDASPAVLTRRPLGAG